MNLSVLYAIVDAEVLKVRRIGLRNFADGLRKAGVSLVQYRDKLGQPQGILAGAAVLREVFAGTSCRLILNDRADLAVLAGWDGVHVGQGRSVAGGREGGRASHDSHSSHETRAR